GVGTRPVFVTRGGGRRPSAKTSRPSGRAFALRPSFAIQDGEEGRMPKSQREADELKHRRQLGGTSIVQPSASRATMIWQERRERPGTASGKKSSMACSSALGVLSRTKSGAS